VARISVESDTTERVVRLSAALLPLLLLASLAAPARAKEPTPSELQAARDLFAQAEKDEEAQNWEAALEKLRRAASVKMTPGLRFHIATCELKLGQLAAALSDFAAAEQLARAQGNKDVLAATEEPLRDLRARVPQLTVRVPDVTGAEVLLDGNRIAPGLHGVPMPVDPGSHRIEARAPGRAAFAKTVQLEERQSAIVEVELAQPRQGSAPPTTAPPPDDEPPQTDGGEGGGRSKVPAVLATLGAMAFVGVGVGFFVAAEGSASSGREFCATAPPMACDAKQAELRDGIRGFDAAALGFWIGAGALGAVATGLWIHALTGPTTKSEAHFVLGPGTLGLRGTF
jgi:hypothetical protein